MIRIEVEQNSEAWYQNRVGRITASNFKSLMSGETTKGYNELVMRIVTEIDSDGSEIEDSYKSPDMERGTELEPEARGLYSEIYDIIVQETGLCIPDEDNEFYEWLGISPDGLMPKIEKLLEIKCPRKKTHVSYLAGGVLPNEYKPQVQGQLFVTGYKSCDFMSYYPGLNPFIITVYPDLEYHKKIEDRLRVTIKRIKTELEAYKEIDIDLSEI